MERARNKGRRMFLHSVTGAALGIPFLESILPRGVRAQAAAPIRRFVGMQQYSGQVAKEWYPTATSAAYKLRDTMFPGTVKADGTTYLGTRIAGTKYSIAPLADFGAGGVSKIIGTQLNTHLDKINLLRGIDLICDVSHNMGAYFGNYNSDPAAEKSPGVPLWPRIPTIDQVMAYSSKVYPAAPRQRSLSLGTGQEYVNCSYSNYGAAGGKVEMVNAIIDPALAFDAAFKGFMVTTGTPKDDPNRVVVNGIHEDYARVTRNPRIGAADKQLLDRHMTFLADIERKLLAATQATVCTVPTRAPASIGAAVTADRKGQSNAMAVHDAIPLLLDIAAAAIRCDITRVVSFNIVKSCYYDAAGALRVSYHESAGVAGDWHDFAHNLGDPVKYGNFNAISKWIIGNVFGAMLDRLDVPEANGKTYLDNSLVVLGNELSYGHTSTDVQTIMAGSAGGFLKTGSYVDYIDWGQSVANNSQGLGVNIPGIPNTRWLVTMLQAMGLQPADYETGGLPGYGPNFSFQMPVGGWPAPTALGTVLPGIVA